MNLSAETYLAFALIAAIIVVMAVTAGTISIDVPKHSLERIDNRSNR